MKESTAVDEASFSAAVDCLNDREIEPRISQHSRKIRTVRTTRRRARTRNPPFSGHLPPSSADGADAKCHSSSQMHTAGDTVHSRTRGPEGGTGRFTQQPASGLPDGTPNSHSDVERSSSQRHENALLIAAVRLRYAQLATALELIEHQGRVQTKLAIEKKTGSRSVSMAARHAH